VDPTVVEEAVSEDPMTVEAIEERAGAQVVVKWYRHG
jgi:hypothetical protein